jgi:RNA polymerase sigma-70 factor (ECF subfamily)
MKDATTYDVGRELCACRALLFTRALFLERSRDAAEDLVQETIERAIRHADRFTAGTNLVAWSTRIMRNLFADKIRHLSCERRSDLPPPEPARDLDSPIELLGGDDVRAAVARLPALYRRPFELIALDGRSLKETAARLRIAPSTAGTRLFRARRMLRDLLVRHYQELRAAGAPPGSGACAVARLAAPGAAARHGAAVGQRAQAGRVEHHQDPVAVPEHAAARQPPQRLVHDLARGADQVAELLLG